LKIKLCIFTIFCFSLAMLIGACCPKNPTLNSCITAHGNTDWHIDTAEEFLTGRDMAGNPSAANHCPNSWTKRHMHVGLSNTNHYYYDPDLTTPGDDSDPTNGIDMAMLFFYAGHGNPTTWNCLGNNGHQTNVQLGDCPPENGGLLRYYWQCSCAVFAHGPKVCPGSTHDYTCPGSFDGSPDSNNMRNVFERWGPAIDPDLRMACGASTSAYCHESQTNRIWYNYNILHYDVADAFINGLKGTSWVVPLCITCGGADVTATPLYDATFTNLANQSGRTHYHIQYLSSFASTPRTSSISMEIPEALPVFDMGLMSKPRSLQNKKLEVSGDMMVSEELAGDRGSKVTVYNQSGAVYIMGERTKETSSSAALSEEIYLDKAKSFIKTEGWSEREMAAPIGNKIMIESMPIKGENQEIQKTQKDVIVSFARQIQTENGSIPVLGEGGKITIQMNNDGSIYNASKVWRSIKQGTTQSMVQVKNYEEAYKEALEQLENSNQYRLDNWTWGYKELAGNIKQDKMGIVFIFEFMPISEEDSFDYPPQMIEIAGQDI